MIRTHTLLCYELVLNLVDFVDEQARAQFHFMSCNHSINQRYMRLKLFAVMLSRLSLVSGYRLNNVHFRTNGYRLFNGVVDGHEFSLLPYLSSE